MNRRVSFQTVVETCPPTAIFSYPLRLWERCTSERLSEQVRRVGITNAIQSADKTGLEAVRALADLDHAWSAPQRRDKPSTRRPRDGACPRGHP
jgi:hypothetical protein